MEHNEQSIRGRLVRREDVDGRDVIRFGLIVLFATCTAVWAEVSYLRIFSTLCAAFYSIGLVLGSVTWLGERFGWG